LAFRHWPILTRVLHVEDHGCRPLFHPARPVRKSQDREDAGMIKHKFHEERTRRRQPPRCTVPPAETEARRAGIIQGARARGHAPRRWCSPLKSLVFFNSDQAWPQCVWMRWGQGFIYAPQGTTDSLPKTKNGIILLTAIVSSIFYLCARLQIWRITVPISTHQ
jgi:hypothetical protein